MTMNATQQATNNITLARRDSYSAWLSGFNAYHKGVYGDLVKYGSPHWRAGYYDAQAAVELADLQEAREDVDFFRKGC